MTDQLVSLRAVLLSAIQNDHEMFRQAASTVPSRATTKAPSIWAISLIASRTLGSRTLRSLRR